MGHFDPKLLFLHLCFLPKDSHSHAQHFLSLPPSSPITLISQFYFIFFPKMHQPFVVNNTADQSPLVSHYWSMTPSSPFLFFYFPWFLPFSPHPFYFIFSFILFSFSILLFPSISTTTLSSVQNFEIVWLSTYLWHEGWILWKKMRFRKTLNETLSLL